MSYACLSELDARFPPLYSQVPAVRRAFKLTCGTATLKSMGNDFEAAREANIAANKARLVALGLVENVVFVSRKKTQQAKTKKRKPSPTEEPEVNENDERPARKMQVIQAAEDGAGPRRSGRHTGKKVDYSGDGDLLNKDKGPRILTEKARNAAEKEPMGVQNRTQNP
jgi:E3 ubiquitin-protein ligase UHRF1